MVAGAGVMIASLWPVFLVNIPSLARIPGALGATLAFVLFRQGQKRWQPTFAEAIQRDRRKPVVYFREFRWDGYSSRNLFDLFLGVVTGGAYGGRPETFEEQVKAVLKKAGPVVALGRPVDELPELGAARLYVADADWMTVATRLLQHAGAAVFVVTDLSMTLAMAAEWELAKAHLPPERRFVLLWMSGRQLPCVRWREGNERYTRALGLPTSSVTELEADQPAVLTFNSDGSAHSILGPDHGKPHYLTSLLQALSESGMKLQPLSWWHHHPSLLTLTCLLVYLSIFVVAVMILESVAASNGKWVPWVPEPWLVSVAKRVTHW